MGLVSKQESLKQHHPKIAYTITILDSQKNFLTTLLPHGYSFQKVRWKKQAQRLSLNVKGGNQQIYCASQLHRVKEEEDLNQQKIEMDSNQEQHQNLSDGSNSANYMDLSPEKYQQLLQMLRNCQAQIRITNQTKRVFQYRFKKLYEKVKRHGYPQYIFFQDDLIEIIRQMKQNSLQIVKHQAIAIQQLYLTFLGSYKDQEKQDRPQNQQQSSYRLEMTCKRQLLSNKQSKNKVIHDKKKRKKKKSIFSAFSRRTRCSLKKKSGRSFLPPIPQENQTLLETSIDQALTQEEVDSISSFLKQLCVYDRQRLLKILVTPQNLQKLIKSMKKKDASTFIDHLLLTYEKNALEPNDSEGTAAQQSLKDLKQTFH